MNTTKGSYVIASGNTFQWEHRTMKSKGAIHGVFASAPTDADLREAHEFCVRLTPPRSRVALEGLTNRQRSNALIDRHLIGGSRN